MHWPRNILDPLVPLVLEPVGQLIADLVPCYPRDADPARLRKGFQPRRDIDSIAEEIVALNHDVAHVNADAEPHLLSGRYSRILFGDGFLHRDGALHRIHCAREVSDETISRRVENSATMRGDQAIGDSPVLGQGPKRRDLISPHHAAVALHISGKDRGELAFDGWRFQLRHLPDLV